MSGRDKARKEEKEQEGEFFVNPQGHPRDRVIIHESQDLPKEGIYMALNGYSFLAKAGVPIDLPRPVRLMLDTRLKTEMIQGDDGKNHFRDIPRLTYTLVKEGVNLPEEVVEEMK
jgi:hypothetical protein